MANGSNALSCSVRARGDARPDSDYDIAIFLKFLPDRWTELDRLAKLRVDFLDETDAFFDTKPYSAEAYLERSPLMHEIRQEGLEVWPRRQAEGDALAHLRPVDRGA